MGAGRNDPCPCGSGQKYKKCCGSPARVLPFRPPGPYTDAERISAVRRLAEWLGRPAVRAEWMLAMAQFWDLRGPEPDPAVAGAMEADDGAVKFLAWFGTDARSDTGGSHVDDLLRRRGAQMLDGEREYLRRLSAARLRPYEVVESRPGQGVRLRDLLGGGELDVVERSASEQLVRWDVVAARLVDGPEGPKMDLGIYVFPVELKADLLAEVGTARAELLEEQPEASENDFLRGLGWILHQFWMLRVLLRPSPALTNTDGHHLELRRVSFEVLDEDGLSDALGVRPDVRQVEGGWDWVRPEGDDRGTILGHLRRDGARLVAEVNSKARGVRLRALIHEWAPGLVRFKSSRRIRMDSPGDARPEAIGPEGEDVQEALAAFKEQHYRAWPDVALPALDGRTPREAAGDAAGRSRLVELIREMENHEARAPGPPYDFTRLRRELGMPAE